MKCYFLLLDYTDVTSWAVRRSTVRVIITLTWNFDMMENRSDGRGYWKTETEPSDGFPQTPSTP